MPSQNGRALLLKIGDGNTPQTFTTIGAARTTSMDLSNQPQDATCLDSAGLQALAADAGVQSLRLSLDGLFKDSAAEELLRTAAFERTSSSYQIFFPNGDTYEASFVVQDYQRKGAYDGLETFSVTLLRDGEGSYTHA